MSEASIAFLRGGRVESRHAIHAAVCDGDGALVAAVGNPDEVVFLRSAAKPFQAAAAVRAGAIDAFGVTDEEVAVMCASHSGEDVHLERVRAALDRIGLSESSLRCGAHPPLDPRVAEELAGRFTAIHNNCSGKHAGMLALTRHLGAQREGYLDPASPAQQEILAEILRVTGAVREQMVVAIDGCSAPTFALPIRRGATAFARLAIAGEDEPLGRVARIMTAHPHLVGGTGRFDTMLMTNSAKRLVSKGGAEAVQGIADRHRGLGILIKVTDGGHRAVAPAAAEILRQLGGWHEELLGTLHETVLRNYGGIVVGAIEPRFGLRRF